MKRGSRKSVIQNRERAREKEREREREGSEEDRGESVLKRVRGPKITENSWKSAHVGEGGREKEEDRSNEADSLFSVFSASGGIGRLSGAFFLFFLSLSLSPSPSPFFFFLFLSSFFRPSFFFSSSHLCEAAIFRPRVPRTGPCFLLSSFPSAA